MLGTSKTRWSLFVAAAAVSAGACSSDIPRSSTEPAPITTLAPRLTEVPTTTAAPTTTIITEPLNEQDRQVLAELNGAAIVEPPVCEILDQRQCFLPFPSDFFTTGDASTDTRRRVQLVDGGAPTNASGTTIDLTEWNRNDGFSPNTPILTYIADLDPQASKLPKWTDIGASLAPDATIVLVDANTGERIPLWAELDAHAQSDADRLLTIRPAIVLPEGHTFAVGLRGMITTQGEKVAPNSFFRIWRDGLPTKTDWFEALRKEMEKTFTTLQTAGIDRHELQLAWSFTTASSRNNSERMLHIRDEALQTLGDVAPAYTVTAVTPNTDDNVALQVEGTFTVPNYLTGDGGPGNRFNYDPSKPDLPAQNGTLRAPFVCNISVNTMNGAEPAHLVIYGHGLLGDHHEIDAGNVRAMSNEYNVVHCATKWAGMSEDDVANAIATLQDFSNFPTMADRLQQGVLNQIFLGRLMTRSGGLGDDPNFKRPDGSALIDTTHLDYDGNSQGGIMGAMLAAVSPDIERAVLGVTGMNYSLLLPRSVDFDTYEAVFAPAYPSDLDRPLILALTQMLWDRGEAAGYIQHLTANPYPGTKAKTVLLDVAYGDHQVSQLSALIEARAIGATIHRPVAADGRWAENEPGWGLKTTVYPSKGSALIIWDSGVEPIPFENLAPRAGDDPHEDPRADADVRRQKASFLFDDILIDVCGGKACTADHRQ